MKLHQLRDYLAIAEKGSIRAAAKHLGIGQPALSRSVRNLEQEVGTSLLDRHASGAVLTELGKAFRAAQRRRLPGSCGGRWRSCSSCRASCKAGW